MQPPTSKPAIAGLLDSLFDRLFPICRSITGPGLRNSLEIFAEHMPLSIEHIASETRVFDWTVPREWLFSGASLTGPDGQIVADAGRSNLEVVNYSDPIDAELSLDELQPHLHSIPSIPDAIPYVTSYYRRQWGFCLSQEARDRLQPGKYQARIDTELVDGHVSVGTAILPGESTAEILISSYLCHPSLANNELSGPLVLLGLYWRIASWPRRRFTYRFVLNPETIGSLCYLYLHGDHLRSHMISGLVLTCLGGPERRLSLKQSRRGDSLLDATARNLHATSAMDLHFREFDPTGGSDERQYCSPGFNLPVSQMARTLYGAYEGYHNSHDTKEFMGIDPLVESIDEIEVLLKAVESAGVFRNLCPYGEPQLGARGLYPNTNSPLMWKNSTDAYVDGRTLLNRMLILLNYADGTNSMIDIAARCGCSLAELAPVIDRLEEAGLLRHDYPSANEGAR